MAPMPLRLIDLHTDWLLQYAFETTVFDPALYPSIPARLAQTEAYLQTTWAAVIACFRSEEDWARQIDPWAALGTLITRIEAEFPGRLLIGPSDVVRWRANPDSLCWGMIGVEGFDALVRTAKEVDRLPSLFDRGVRVFQPVYDQTSLLGGSSQPGDVRGLTDLGRAFLETLAALALGPDGPRPIVDLAHLNPRSASDVLTWLESDPERARRVIPVYSHGALAHEAFTRPRAITRENLERLRALGGVIGFCVGPPFYPTADALKASIEEAASLPFRGQPGYEGIAIGTDFLGVSKTLPGLGNAPEVVAWLHATFAAETAAALLQSNAMALFERAAGLGPNAASARS
jgi:membrane dipeptidase